MVQLGRRYGNGPASLAEIAAVEDLPRAYLEQLVTSLRDAGLVVSTRGARGGYELARPPDQIRMSEVLRALEGPIAPMICASDEPEHIACDRSARCTVNVLWIRVRDAITGTLDGMTLADLVPVRHITLDPRLAGTVPRPAAAEDRSPPPRSQEPLRDRRQRPGARHPRPAGRSGRPPRPGDPQGDQPHDPQGRGPRDHGPQRLRQDHPQLRADGPPGLHRCAAARSCWKGYDLLKLSPDKRARLGLFLAFQYPTAIPGLSVASFVRSALNAKLQGIDKNPDIDPTDADQGRRLDARLPQARCAAKMALLRMDDGFAARYVNDGFSGGEKKRLEMLQMAMLEPEFAILDETDSGLDIDALRIVAEGVNAQLNPDMGVLLITHYQRLLNYITPDVVHVLADGQIVTSGGKDLALRLEEEGYGPILRENGMETNLPDEALAVPQEPEAAGASR